MQTLIPEPNSHEVLIRIEAIDAYQGELTAEEQATLSNSADVRVREYTAARTLAREVITEILPWSGSIPTDSDRCPIWPDGVSGSISHTRSHVGVAIARSARISGIGIDLEPVGSVTQDLYDRLFIRGELDFICSSDDQIVPTQIFCCKEAVYKAAFPTTRTFLDFHQLEIRLLQSEKEFEVVYSEDPETLQFIDGGKGYVDVIDGHVQALFVINASNTTAGV
tara:strand:+ start:503 stop:1171 length:669 start_codon:yes stop_codon:yes gene_type:complete